jgi:hypothetical protein
VDDTRQASIEPQDTRSAIFADFPRLLIAPCFDIADRLGQGRGRVVQGLTLEGAMAGGPTVGTAMGGTAAATVSATAGGATAGSAVG